MLRKALKWFLLLALVFAVVWVLVIIYWQVTGANPGATSLVVYLLVLPAALIAGYFGLKTGIDVGKKRAARKAEAANGTDAPGADATPDENSPERAFNLSLLDSAIRLPLGADAEEAAALLAEGSERPGLDEQLADGQGFPVFAARAPDLADEGLAEELALPETYDETPLTWTPEQIRALCLAGEVVDQISSGMLAQANAFLAKQTGDAEPPAGQRAPTTTLKFALSQPADWPQAIREAAQSWLQARIETAEHSMISVVAETLTTTSGMGALQYIDQLSVDLNRQDIQGLCLLLACESSIGEASVAQLDADGKLFNQANPTGQIPAEGAAAVLLATPELAASVQPDPCAYVHRGAFGKREKSADEKGRITGDLVNELTQQVVSCAAASAEEICCILADSGIQPGRAMEMGALTGGDFVHLDSTSQCLSIGAACGQLGCVATVAALALAQTQSLAQEKPVLILAMQDGLDRAALVMQPNGNAYKDTDKPETNEPAADSKQATA